MKKIYILFILPICFLIPLTGQTQIVLNEFMAGNLDWNADSLGEYDDWIELYNAGEQAQDAGGFFLSDDEAVPQKWQISQDRPKQTTIPAGGFLLIWADGAPQQGLLHANFKLSSSGEPLLLSAPNGSLLDSIHFGKQFANVSYGRYPDGSSGWYFFGQPTPAAANAAGYLGVAPPAQISPSAFVGSAATQVTLSAPDLQTQIRYTLDCSEPTEYSALYSGLLTIDSSAVLRTRVFKTQYIPGKIATGRYFINEILPLPVLSLVTDPENLFSSKTGIYKNYLQEGREWERPLNVQFFRNSTLQFDVEGGIRIQGSTSRSMAKKSFRLFFRKGYGADRLLYNLFNTRVQSFKNLVLRSGYDDDITTSQGTLLRDPLVNEIWLQTGHLTSRGNFASLFLNRAYWGVYNIRESINDYFITDHLNQENFDLIRYTKWGIQLKYGQRADWDAMWRFFENSDFTQDSVYQKAQKLIDIDNFTDLQALAQCSEYRSWTWGVFAFKEQTPAAKWRWTIWDMDRAFADIRYDVFADYYSSASYLWGGLMMKQLLNNAAYKIKFINRIADYLNSAFRSERVVNMIDSLSAIIEPDMPEETQRWNSDMDKWRNNVEYLRSFARQRPAVLRQQILNKYALPATHLLTVALPANGGRIRVNTLTIAENGWQGSYFENVPLTVTALPAPGYKFAGWNNGRWPQRATVALNLISDSAAAPLFTPLNNSTGLRIVMPRKIKAGERVPLIISARDAKQRILTTLSDTVTVRTNGALTDSTIYLKRGLGTLVSVLKTSSSFRVKARYKNLAAAAKNIQVAQSFPQTEYSGSLPAGTLIWDDTSDRLITGNLAVPKETHLIIKAGTRVLLDDKINVTVYGQVEVRGSAEQPVLFTALDWEKPWGGFEFHGGRAVMNYAFFLDGGGDPNKGWKHMNIQPILFARDESRFDLEHVFILNSPGKALGSEQSRVDFKESVVAFVRHGGEFVNTLLHYDGCYVMNIPNDLVVHDSGYVDYDNDGMHVDYVYQGSNRPSRISNSVFYHGRDDAIDHNNAKLEISGCWLDDWIHEGVAASGGNFVKVFNTVATRCTQGYEAGHGSPQVYLDHCLALDNAVGIRFGDSYHTAVTGHITATNCITYDNTSNIRNYVKNLSGPAEGAIDISYSMTNDNYDNDPDYNVYPHCITGTPQFDENDYLLPESDGAAQGMWGSNMGRADSIVITGGSVIINEIMYKASDRFNSKDWVELFNGQNAAQNIGGWTLKDDDDNHRFNFPENTIMAPFGYIVVCRDTNAFKTVYPLVKKILGNFSFGLGKGDQVRLFSAQSDLVDGLTYHTSAPWPASANGGGASLELIDYHEDNTLAQNWAASQVAGGTPGEKNSVATAVKAPSARRPLTFSLEQNYPNPFNSTTQISYTVETTRASSLPIKLTVYNILGQQVKILGHEKQTTGNHTILFDGSHLASGVYFYKLQIRGAVRIRKMILLR